MKGSAMPTWQSYLDQHQDQYLKELLNFLRIPSVSALPEHAADVQRAAQWVVQRLQQAGIEDVQILPHAGPPVVYGQWLHAPDRPTVLIYGHFDTQPADPLALWSHPPFEPAVQDGRVYGRGASDDKGNMLVPILAIEALLKSMGSLPINLKVLFEGEEEVGSPHLAACIATHQQLLACDLAVSADGGQAGEDQPSLEIGLRGMCALQIDVTGANGDLHSGLYGGVLQNPIGALVHILDSMRKADGSIAVAGFYDDVEQLSADDRAMLAAVPFDAASYTAALGVPTLVGEPGYTPLERLWARPTLEINGIWGGFQGEGIKTVIPNHAHAKLSFRLVANQDPDHIIQAVTDHIHAHTPTGVTVKLQPELARGRPYLMPADHWGNLSAAKVLQRIYGKQPLYTRSGGSIPACTILHSALGVYTVGFAFGLDDEQFHAPNEFFRLSSFRRGQAAYCELFGELAAHGA